MKIFPLAVLAALLVSPLRAQEAPDTPDAAAARTVLSVTVILRLAGQNIPSKFTGYMMKSGDGPSFPLLHPETTGWIASIDVFTWKEKTPEFGIRIIDTSHLVSVSSPQSPNHQIPLQVLECYLPLQIGAEIQVYKSRDLSLTVLFESQGD